MEETGITFSDESHDELFAAFGRKKPRELDHRWKRIEDDEYRRDYDDYRRDYGDHRWDHDDRDSEDARVGWRTNDEPTSRKRVRVRIPVVRTRAERQHKYTVVRRRPLVPYSKPVAPIVDHLPTARRIVVTRVRPRGRAHQFPLSEDIPEPEIVQPPSSTRHRVTVTRRRKLRPTSTSETIQRPRVTRKKLVTVRPVVQPTPTFAIITTGFYTAPSASSEDEYEENGEDVEEEDEDAEDAIDQELDEKIEEPKVINNAEETPSLLESPNDIDSKPEDDFDDGGADEPSKFELEVPEEVTTVSEAPIIITDHFFFPASDGDDEEEGEQDEVTTEGYVLDSVSTEEPPSTTIPQEDTSEDSKTDLPEISTVPAIDPEPEVTTPVAEETTEKSVEKSVEKSEDADKTIVPVTDSSNVEQIQNSTTDEPKDNNQDSEQHVTTDGPTEATSEPELSSVTEKTNVQLTIQVEEESTEVAPETTSKPLTIFIEKESERKEDPTFDFTTFAPEEPKYQSSEQPEEPTTTENYIDLTVEDLETPDTNPMPATDEDKVPTTTESVESEEEDLSVIPLDDPPENSSEVPSNTLNISPSSTWSRGPSEINELASRSSYNSIEEDDSLSVIPLESDTTSIPKDISASKVDTTSSTASKVDTTSSTASVTTSYDSPTPEDIEGGLADELYLSLSRPDFPQLSPSKPLDPVESTNVDNDTRPTPELSTSVYYTETVVTSTKLRTYTYVVTKLNGLETEVTSSTTVRPRVTTLTLTVPVTMTITPTPEPTTYNSVAPVYSPVSVVEHEVREEEEGRRFNLATRVMSNGVEVIVAGPTPALRWENSNPQPTLSLSDTVVMLMPQEEPNEFVTKTCTTTFTYLNTIMKDGATIVSTDQQVVANTATEERHRKPGTESASVTLEASPTLRTEVFKTTYTYLTLNTDHPDVNNALDSSMKVITNTVTAPQHYLDMLEPSEAAQPETNSYLSTRVLEKIFMEDGRTRIETISDTVTQLIITESAPPPPRPTSVATTLTALDNIEDSMTDITKTYFITYTYYNTYLEKGSTVTRTNVATSTDIVLEKAPTKKTSTQSVSATPTPEPIQIFATKTYLTTYTYFITLLQAGADGENSTTISSRSHIVENVVTESIAPSLLDPGYMNALLTTAHHSDSVKNVVTGSTIIFFDEEDQIDPTTTSSALSQSTATPEVEDKEKVVESTSESSQANPTSETNGSEAQPGAELATANESHDDNATLASDDSQNNRPANPGGDLQVSNLLSLGSLGINSLSALGPVITAMAGMAGLLQSKTTATRRNDTVAPIETQEVTTQRSPIYIPVAEFADGDIETAESQNIAAQLANPNLNYIPETRHKVAASLADGIPISPGEVITANSDVIIGKPGKLGPRPPPNKGDEHIGMKPPPMPVPNIPVHPVLEVIHDDEADSQGQASSHNHRNTQIQILSAHQVYEKHLKVPGPAGYPPKLPNSLTQKRPHQIQSGPLKQATNKLDHLENDPLLKPPSRPNVEQYANPNINPKEPEWNRDRFRRPWSAKDPLTPPLPPSYEEAQTESSHQTEPWPNRAPGEEQKRPPWAQKDPLLGDTTVVLESSENKPLSSEPIIHQVPHVIDRSTGQPLLVNIQPSQVANVVIPQGGTQALIFGDTSEPHISGQYFDDPSPYPEPEVGPGFVGVDKIENDPAIYMVPPAPPTGLKNSHKQSNKNHPQTIPLSQNHFNLGRPQDSAEIQTNTRLEKRPSQVLLIQRPDSHGQSSQGHVHTEILVHHRPESVNIRPQAVSQSHSHSYPENHEPPRRDYSHKHQRPAEQTPPRRTEILAGPTDNPHPYIYLDNKPNEPGNDLKQNWKYDRKPQRHPPGSARPDRRPERPSNRPRPPVSSSYPIFERPGGYPNRKPQYPSSPHRNPPSSTHYSNNPNWNSHSHHEPPKKIPAQARPIQSYPKDPRPGHNGHMHPDNLAPGVAGYYNPSNNPNLKPDDTRYHPQFPAARPEIQNFGQILPHREDPDEISWQSDTQTERTTLDSANAASVNVKFHDKPHDHQQESHEQSHQPDNIVHGHQQDVHEQNYHQDFLDQVHQQQQNVHEQHHQQEVHEDVHQHEIHETQDHQNVHNHDHQQDVYGQGSHEDVHRQDHQENVHEEDHEDDMHRQEEQENVDEQNQQENNNEQNHHKDVHEQDHQVDTENQDDQQDTNGQDNQQDMHGQDDQQGMHGQDDQEDTNEQDDQQDMHKHEDQQDTNMHSHSQDVHSQTHQQDNHEQVDKNDDEEYDVQTSPPVMQPEDDLVHTESSYDTVGSVNTVVGKPVDIQQSIFYENQNKNPLNFGHQQEHPGIVIDRNTYNSKPYENPIVQGKPYGAFNSQMDTNRPFGQHQADNGNRADYEVIQGVPFSQHGGKRPLQDKRPKPFNRDDTVDLKPPAIIPQFGKDRPGRPFSRLPVGNSRPENRPGPRPRPEVDGHHDGHNNRPRDPLKNPISDLLAEHTHLGSAQNVQDSIYSRPGWNQGSRPSDNSQPQAPTRPVDRDHFEDTGNNENRYERRNETISDSSQGSYFPSLLEGSKPNSKPGKSSVSNQSSGTRVHPTYPHILTKPRPSVPGPVTISSGSKRPDLHNRPNIQFSLPVEASGEEKDSKTQTERPPSMLITAGSQKNKKQKEETLETAFQTNFATSSSGNVESADHEVKIIRKPTKESGTDSGKPKVPSQSMMPPPVRKSGNSEDQLGKDKSDEGLKPPPIPSDVLGLSPPPVAITTTGRPKEERFPYNKADEADLRPPPKYIPLKESAGPASPPQPSTRMVPPSPRPTHASPYLVDLLSQEMAPPPLVIETSRPTIEIATVRPAIAVSGSIQIATAVAASHIPVMQDTESKIPIIHGTVDFPVVIDASEIIKPQETQKPEHVSIYTVRPFETRPISRVSVQPTTKISSNLIMPTKLRPPQIDQVQTTASSTNRISSVPIRVLPYNTPRRPTKKPDHPIFLEPSRQNVHSSMEIEPTQSLTQYTNRAGDLKLHATKVQKHSDEDSSSQDLPMIVTRVRSSITRMTNTLLPRRDKLPNLKEYAGTVIHEVVKNGTTATVEMKPKAVTHYRTLTVTRTETSVLGTPPTTRTLLLTSTLTSTIVETVTETLLRPTSIVATVTSTVLQSVTRLPNSYENTVDNDSIFVVMSDQNPPAAGAEEVEAEYGEDEVSRDEQDPVGNEIHRVLAGGILGAPSVPMRPAIHQCQPECKASKAEVCSATGTEARCVCRPGFARMFPDRPCKPTYTYTLRVALERVGREPVFYEAALNDTRSTAYRRLAGPTKEALDRTMMQSDLRDIYRGLEIAGFVPNPTQVEFHVQLTDNANETRLKEVLRKYLIGSNYSLGGTEVYAARELDAIDARDFDECSMQEGGLHHDCSPHAACFNLRGSYQCSCREGWADLSENPAYPGRVCSQAPLGCAGCNNKGHCTTNIHGQEVCECFPWHSGQRCQVNLKVLLIALVTVGTILLGLLVVCLGLACFRHPGRRRKSGDRRAMIPGTAGDTSSEGSVTDLAIPHHVPHVLPPPPRSVAPAPPAKRPARKITPSGKRCRSPRKASIATTVPVNEENCNRSLTVMIPRAKYRSTQQPPQNYKPAMSTFAADEHKLISYLENGAQSGNHKHGQSNTKNFGKSYEESGIQMVRSGMTTSGALVSAGFQVSATVTRTGDAESTLGRSCAETMQVEPSMKTSRSTGLEADVGSTLARSCADTSTSTKLLRLDFGDSSGSTLAKSCGETTIQTSTKHAPSRRSDSKDTRDSGSEGRLTMERDLGSTLRLTPQHSTLYKPDRTSDRDSNFDSL